MFLTQTKVESKPGSAFSLMELIVVVAVVAVMLMIAISAHAKPRNRVYQTTDVSNQRRLLQAATSYAADHSDTLPNSGWGLSLPNWACAANLPAGGGGTFTAFNAVYPVQLASLTNGQAFPYLHEPRVFMCPADRPDNSSFWQRNIYITSYVWNGAVNGYTTISAYKLSRFRPDAILQWEADGSIPLFFNDPARYPDEGISARHGTETWVGMFGGGVVSMSRTNFNALAASSTANQLWCNPATLNTTGH